VSLYSIFPLALAVAAITVFLVTLIIRSHKSKVTTGETGLEGTTGTVTRTLGPEGQVFLHGEIWRARSHDQSEIVENTKVIVVKSEGLTLIVEPLENNSKEDR
jgi:membrane-bound serine protease (ClpP class)